MAAFDYPGTELELFAEARNWKRYWSQMVRPYVGPHVLDVGAGLGATAKSLTDRATTWTCLEPDEELARRLAHERQEGRVPAFCEIITGTLEDLPPGCTYDSVLYIDVLEHIEDDRAELSRAAAVTKPGGHVVVLAPAMPALFSRFDEAIGHCRRYTRETLRAAAPPELQLVCLRYLDIAGLVTSAANAWLLRQAQPSSWQIRLWDRGLVPVSRVADRAFGFTLGRSVLAVWKRGCTSKEGMPQHRRPEARAEGRPGGPPVRRAECQLC